MESLIELKARAYDAAVQVKAWQDIQAKLITEINNYVEPVKPSENGTDTPNEREHRLSTAE